MNDEETIDLDALLEGAVLHGAITSGRDPRLAARQFGAARVAGASTGEALRAPAGVANRWSAADDAYLREWSGVISDEELAARLGRSPAAIRRVRNKRKGLHTPAHHPDYLTALGVARVLGVDGHTVMKWIDRGILPAEAAPVATAAIRRIRRDTFYAWALRPVNWVYFLRPLREGRISDERLRRLLARRAETWGDEWWTTGQAADYHGVISNDVMRYIEAGRLPAVRWGNWYVLRSDATRPGLRFFRGKGAGIFERRGTAAGDAFLVLGAAVGIPWVRLARMMDIDSTQARYAAVARRGLIPALIRTYDLPVVYRPEDGATWADWRPLSTRFPAVARAWAGLAAGERPSFADLHLLSGVMRAYLRFGRPEHPLLRRPTAGLVSAAALRELMTLYGEEG